jgi:hypothetical protein
VPQPGVPPLTETGGWWAIAFPDEDPIFYVNRGNDTAEPLLAGATTYDVYWAQNPDEPPRLIAEDVAVALEIVDVPIPPLAPPGK